MNSESTTSQSSQTSFSMDDFAQALEEHDYQFKRGQVVRGKVFQHDSNGAYVDIGGKSAGFVPLQEAALQRVENLEEFLPLHEEVELMIIREQDSEGQVLLSRRQLQVKQAWDDLKEIETSGKSTQIRVTGTNRGGVTGQVNGLRGFIPRSHLIDQSNLEALVGQLLTATLLQVDPENRKLVLSQRKAVQADAISKLEALKLMEGTVGSIKNYGVFVNLDGVSGLLHIKEISGKRIDSLEELFEVGQSIKVMILNIDEWNNRISLSTKVLETHAGEILENMDEVMATAESRAQKYREQLLAGEG